MSSTYDPDIRSYGDNYNDQSVWSFEYQEFVDLNDFKRNESYDSGYVNRYIKNHPTSGGKVSEEVFKYHDLAGEYQLN